MVQNLCIVFVNEIPKKLPDYTKLDQSLLTGASGKGVINPDAFTKKTFLQQKTTIITKQDYEDLEQIYKTKPYFNLFRFDIFDTEKSLSTDKSKLCCIILFINDIYSYHYVCAIDTIEKTKQRFKNIIEKNNMGSKNYSLLKINFDEYGKFTASNDEPLIVVL